MSRPKARLDLELIVRQYRDEQLGLRQIARLHGVSHETVRRYLLEAGVDLRVSLFQTAAEVDGMEVLQGLRDQGVSVAELAAQYQVSEQTIYRRLGGDY